MSNRAHVEVDLSAIADNVRLLQKRAGVPLLAVVKADAYGHGLVPVAKAALSAGAQWLGVALLEEAIALRAADISAPILSWLAPPGSDYVSALKADIDLAVPSTLIFEEILSAGRSAKKRPRIHIEVDTGMTRGGFLEDWEPFLQIIKAVKEEVDVVGFFSHFARADEPGQSQNAAQLKRFVQMSDDLNEIGIEPEIHHLSNSAATLFDASAHFDLVRTGAAIYGLTPNLEHLGTPQKLGLKPAMTLRAKLHVVKNVPAGSPVGYGASVTTTSETTLGVVAMGYADGIPRIALNAGVFVDGRRAPIMGRVSMDQFVVDLGRNSRARAGDFVTVFGPGDQGEYTADEWGEASSSISYEIVGRIGPRVPRIYKPTDQ